MVSIIVDSFAGFCPGVQKAISVAEELLDKHGVLYSLGELVHCPVETERLAAQGLNIISTDQVNTISDSTILIRAHGVTPELQHMLEMSNNVIVDCTCPIVHRLQHKVKLISLFMEKVDGTIIIFGKKNHPEVIGLMGYCNCKCLINDNPNDVSKVDVNRPLAIFTQTTSNISDFELFISNVHSKYLQSGVSQEDLQIYNTICGQMKKRVPDIMSFAAKHDVIVFVAGDNSSNGAYLESICREVNNNTYKVSGLGQVKKEWFENVQRIGISGAASTPVWLLEQIADEIKMMNVQV